MRESTQWIEQRTRIRRHPGEAGAFESTFTRPPARRLERQRIEPVLPLPTCVREFLFIVVGEDRHGRLRDDCAESSSGTTKCTVHPEMRTPASSTCLCTCRPLKAGSSEGWMLMSRPSQLRTKLSDRTRMKPARHTSSMPSSLSALSISPSKDSRVAWPRWGIVLVGMPALLARARPCASATFDNTSAISAG